MTSPVLRPASPAGLSGVTAATRAPFGSSIDRLSAISGVTPWICTPRQPRLTWPCSPSSARIGDRKSVVSGQSVSVRVDLGDRLILQKYNIHYDTQLAFLYKIPNYTQ